MILIDGRIASLKFRKHLYCYLEKMPSTPIEIPKFTFSDLLKLIIYIFTIPIMTIIIFLEFTVTRQKKKKIFSLLIPVILSQKKIDKIRKKSQKDSVEYHSSFLSKNKSCKIGENPHLHSEELSSKYLSSPLLPFTSFYHVGTVRKNIDLVSFFKTDTQKNPERKIATFPYLASVADTYENLLCNYFRIVNERQDSQNLIDLEFIFCIKSCSINLHVFRTLVARLLNDINKIIRRIYNRDEYVWHVRAQFDENRGSVLLDLQNPDNGYYADPFLFKHKSDIYLFVEEYSFMNNKGVLSVFLLQGECFVKLGICLEEPFHLSFPNVFSDEGEIYMLPESSENRDIRLYKAMDFPLRWKLEVVLMNNVSAVDSLIYKHENMYYLLTSIDLYGLGDHATNLFLFFSPHLNSTNWISSRNNPIITDSGKGRNAGRLEPRLDSNMRLAQSSILNVYGNELNLLEIKKLTLNEFIEIKIEKPNLKVPLNAIGHHHLSSIGDIKVYDFSKYEKRA